MRQPLPVAAGGPSGCVCCGAGRMRPMGWCRPGVVGDQLVEDDAVLVGALTAGCKERSASRAASVVEGF